MSLTPEKPDLRREFRSHDFCHCIFGYLYKYYDAEPRENGLQTDLPCRMSYGIPTDIFYSRIGDCQIKVNEKLRTHFTDVFRLHEAEMYNARECFMEYACTVCEGLAAIVQPTMALLTYCAVVSELNLHFFKLGCFRFAEYAPVVLDAVLTGSRYMRHFIIKGDNNIKGYTAFRNFCRGISRGEIDIGDFDGIGRMFRMQEFARNDDAKTLLRTHARFLGLGSISEDEEEPEVAPDPSSRPSISDASFATSSDGTSRPSIDEGIAELPMDRASRSSIGELPMDRDSRSSIGELPMDRDSRSSIGELPMDRRSSRSSIGGSSRASSVDYVFRPSIGEASGGSSMEYASRPPIGEVVSLKDYKFGPLILEPPGRSPIHSGPPSSGDSIRSLVGSSSKRSFSETSGTPMSELMEESPMASGPGASLRPDTTSRRSFSEASRTPISDPTGGSPMDLQPPTYAEGMRSLAHSKSKRSFSETSGTPTSEPMEESPMASGPGASLRPDITSRRSFSEARTPISDPTGGSPMELQPPTYAEGMRSIARSKSKRSFSETSGTPTSEPMEESPMASGQPTSGAGLRPDSTSRSFSGGSKRPSLEVVPKSEDLMEDSPETPSGSPWTLNVKINPKACQFCAVYKCDKYLRKFVDNFERVYKC